MSISGDLLAPSIHSPIPLDYVVIVLGWHYAHVSPQFVILDYQSHKKLTNNIRTRLQGKEYYRTVHVISLLVARGVKRTSSMIVEIPGGGCCAQVTVRFSTRTDDSVCLCTFWHMEIVEQPATES